MKKLMFFIVAMLFISTAFAQTDVIPLIDGAETQGDISVEYIKVQLTTEIYYAGGFTWTSAVWEDFTILDEGASLNIEPTGATNIVGGNTLPANQFILEFNTDPLSGGNYFLPDKNDLKLDYLPLSGSIPCITSPGVVANLQYTPDPKNIFDGIDPTLTLGETTSNHALADKLAMRNDAVTVYFTANELISLAPAPVITLFPDEGDTAPHESATWFSSESRWGATITITDVVHAEGLIPIKIYCRDVNNNYATFLGDSDVMYKDSYPTTTYVDNDWNDQTAVTATHPTLIWQWDAFKTVQDGIDGLKDTGTLIVNVLAGTYAQDLVIDKTLELAGADKTTTTIKGVAVVDHSEVISVHAQDVKIHGFTIETSAASMGDVTIYGVAVENTGLEICHNTFSVSNDGTGGLITMLVTDSGVGAGFLHNDVGGLNIHDNSFIADPIYETSVVAYEGIYVNYNAVVTTTGNVTIKDNTFEGDIFRAIGTERDNTLIQGNDVSSTLDPGASLYQAYRGIDVMSTSGNLNPNQDNVDIFSNTITDFLWGISLGHTTGCDNLTDIVVGKAPVGALTYGNTITGCSVGIQVNNSADGIVVNYNSIAGNTFGLQNDDAVTDATLPLDAEYNWWGNANGPDHDGNTFNVDAQGQTVTGDVDYVPWNDTDMNVTSFWPVEMTGPLYFSSINAAVNAAVGGETIECKAGTYTPSNYIAIHESGLTLQSVAGAATTIIDASGFTGNATIIIEDGTADVTVDGFTINNSDESAIKIDYNTTGAVVKNNLINNAGAEGISTAYDPTYAPYANLIVDGATISGNTITDCHTGIGIAGCAANCTITGNEISGTTGSRALYIFGGTVANKTHGNTISLNNIHDNNHEGINLNSYPAYPTINHYDNNTISGNTISGNGSYGIEIANNSNVTNLSITQNDINTNTDGIRIYTDVTWGTGNTINNNNITLNTTFGINNMTTTTVDGKINYWGTINGPTHSDNVFNVGSQGNASSDNVDYVPWYDTNMNGSIYAPVEMDSGADAITYYSSINAAVDAAVEGETITCDAGTYTQTASVTYPISIDVDNLTLKGAQYNVDPTQESGRTDELLESVVDATGTTGSTNAIEIATGTTGNSINGFTVKNAVNKAIQIDIPDFPHNTIENHLMNVSYNILHANKRGLVVYDNDTSTFEYNYIHSNTQCGAYFGATASSTTVDHNLITNNTSVQHWAGIMISLGSEYRDTQPTITNNTITNNGDIGITVYSASAIIQGNTITGHDNCGIYVVIQQDADYPTTVINNGNTITGNGGDGHDYNSGIMVVEAAPIIDGNTISNNVPYGIKLRGTHNPFEWGTDVDAEITNNTISNNHPSVGDPVVSSAGIYFRSTGKSDGNGDHKLYCSPTITGNTITGNEHRGILLDEPDPAWSGPAYYASCDPTINDNKIYDNYEALEGLSTGYGLEVKDSGAYVDATENWWGTLNGPTHIGNTFNVGNQGDEVSDYVDYVRWYGDDALTTLFAPVELIAGPPADASGYFSSIQAAIDDAAGGETIECKDGTFTEDFEVDQANLTLVSINGLDNTTIQFAGGHLGIDLPSAVADGFVLGGTADKGFTILSAPGANNTTTDFMIELANAPSDVEISYNAINTTGSASQGISVGAAGADGLTITHNTFTADAGDISVWGVEVTNIDVSYNNCTGPGIDISGSAIQFCGISGTTNAANPITYNTITGYKYPIVVSDGPTTDTHIVNVKYNTVTNCTHGIYVVQQYSNQINTVRLMFNDLSANTNGIHIGAGADLIVNTFIVRKNKIYDNTAYGLLNDNTQEVPAASNWWGSFYGPDHADNPWNSEVTIGNVVDDVVAFMPWSSNVDFIGNVAVHDTDPPTGADLCYTNTIQEGIDLAASVWDFVGVTPGTYTESIVIDKDITLLSERDGVTIQGNPSGSSVVIDILGTAGGFTLGGASGRGFTILSASNTGQLISIENNPHPVVISYCDFVLTGNTAQGIACGAASLEDLTLVCCTFTSTEAGEVMVYGDNLHNSTISNCTFEGAGPATSTGTGVMIWGCPDMTYEDNTFEGLGTGISIWSNSQYEGDIDNNTICGNTFNNLTTGILFGEGYANKVQITTVTIFDNDFTVPPTDVGDVVVTGIKIYNSTYIEPDQFVIGSTTADVVTNGNDFSGCTTGVLNEHTTEVNAEKNWWGDSTGPSFDFTPTMGQGLGVLVSSNVDFTPWYNTDKTGTEYTPLMNKYVMVIDPASPVVDNYFDLILCAADANGQRVFSYGNLVDFSQSHAALTVPDPQQLVNGYKEITDGCISSEIFASGDNLEIYAWEYGSNNAPLYYSTLSNIVIVEDEQPEPPTNPVVTDPEDNGGWITLSYTISEDDPFYVPDEGGRDRISQTHGNGPADNYGVSYYLVERDASGVAHTGDWQFFATIGCYEIIGTNDRVALLNSPASDEVFYYQMASVYNPSDGGTNEKKALISYTPINTDNGSQSEWVSCGGVAAADNLPAYANIKVFLEGAYVAGGTMNTELLTNGLLVGAPANAVDAITLELRTTTTGATVKQADGYVLCDGSVVDEDGNSSFPFYYTTGLEYYFVITHRNHLDIMSANTYTFGDLPSEATDIDLTEAGSVYADSVKEVETGIYALYAGDADNNGQIQNSDKNDYWAVQVGLAGYLSADFNLNGQVQNNDKNDYWQYNVGYGSGVPVQDGDNTKKIEYPIEIVGNMGNRDLVGITFTFDNCTLVGDYFEFDVMVAGSAAGTKLGDTQTYINYSTAGFGANIYGNGKLTVTPGTMLTGQFSGTDLYSLTNIVDNTTSRISITYNYIFSMFPDFANALPITPTQLLHVKIEIANATATAGLSFQGALMAENQYYSDNSTKYNPVVAIDTCDQTLPVILSSFTTAYIEDTPVINWTTQSEDGNAGWNLYRGDTEVAFANGEAFQINPELIEGAGTTSEPTDYEFNDPYEVLAGQEYWYTLESVCYNGETTTYGSRSLLIPESGSGPQLPDYTALKNNYPNPFNPATEIAYAVKDGEIGTLTIYNVKGQIVETAKLPEGEGTYRWEAGGNSSGVYFYKLKTDSYSQVRKMLLVK